MTIFDTDVIVEHLRGRRAATDLLLGAGDTAAISVLTRFELLAGLRSHERRTVRLLLDSLMNVPVTVDIAQQAGEWARTYRSSHSGIGPVDYLIAASAEAHGAELLTLNVRHYPMFPGIAPAL